MASSMNNKNEDTKESSVDHQLLCTICNQPFNDPLPISCGHTFCRSCITQTYTVDFVSCPICRQSVRINGLPEIDHTVSKKIHDHPTKYNEDEQTTLHSEHIHDPIIAATLPFEPFRSLLSDLINHSRRLKEEINQLREQHQRQTAEQFRKNDEFQSANNELKKQTQLYHKTLVEQLKTVHDQYDLSIKQSNNQLATTDQCDDQSKTTKQFQNELNQLKEQHQLQMSKQLRENKELQSVNDELKKQTQLQHQTLVEQLKGVQDQHDLCIKKLNDQSETIKQLQNEINQLREQHDIQVTEKLRENKELQSANDEFKKQTELRHETLVEQLENVHDQYDLCIKNLNDQSETNKRSNDESETTIQFQNAINQLNENNFGHEIGLSKLRTDDQNQNTRIQEIKPHTTCKQTGITIAGGNGKGKQLNQLSLPYGISIDDDQTLFIADYWNHRIVEWKSNAINGRIMAGGNGQGNQTNQLSCPTDVILDQENHSLIIADARNRRVMQWSRRNLTEHGQILLSDIDCYGLAMDKNGSLYVSDCVKNEVKRWKRGETEGTIVAGGNGKGDYRHQLNYPTFIFLDEDDSLYVSDRNNHRVMKWMKDAKEGIVVAGGNGHGQSLKQLSNPRGVIVDPLGQIYVADSSNHRVMRWCKGATEGTIVAGRYEEGEQFNQLTGPCGLSFDRQGNLYVVDGGNDGIQKFEIDFN